MHSRMLRMEHKIHKYVRRRQLAIWSLWARGQSWWEYMLLYLAFQWPGFRPWHRQRSAAECSLCCLTYDSAHHYRRSQRFSRRKQPRIQNVSNFPQDQVTSRPLASSSMPTAIQIGPSIPCICFSPPISLLASTLVLNGIPTIRRLVWASYGTQ